MPQPMYIDRPIYIFLNFIEFNYDCCLSLNLLHFFILCPAMEQFTIAQRVLIVKTFYQNGSPHLT